MQDARLAGKLDELQRKVLGDPVSGTSGDHYMFAIVIDEMARAIDSEGHCLDKQYREYLARFTVETFCSVQIPVEEGASAVHIQEALSPIMRVMQMQALEEEMERGAHRIIESRNGLINLASLLRLHIHMAQPSDCAFIIRILQTLGTQFYTPSLDPTIRITFGLLVMEFIDTTSFDHLPYKTEAMRALKYLCMTSDGLDILARFGAARTVMKQMTTLPPHLLNTRKAVAFYEASVDLLRTLSKAAPGLKSIVDFINITANGETSDRIVPPRYGRILASFLSMATDESKPQ